MKESLDPKKNKTYYSKNLCKGPQPETLTEALLTEGCVNRFLMLRNVAGKQGWQDQPEENTVVPKGESIRSNENKKKSLRINVIQCTPLLLLPMLAIAEPGVDCEPQPTRSIGQGPPVSSMVGQCHI